jgi:probable HAF family extracellular repeat protein
VVRNVSVPRIRFGRIGAVAILIGFVVQLAVLPLSSAAVEIRDLGTLPGDTTSLANGVNDAGQVVGTSGDAVRSDAFLWQDGTMTALGSLPGFASSAALRLNGVGQIVGHSFNTFPAARATLWRDGEIIDLGVLPGDSSSIALDVNGTGHVVGYSYLGLFEQVHAFLWYEGTMTDLGTLGGPLSAATGINDAGQIVGYSATVAGAIHAFLWEDGVMTDLGTLSGDLLSLAASISEAGHVVGVSQDSAGIGHAFFWQGGTMTDLGTLPGDSTSLAVDVNGAGQVVGYSVSDLGVSHAFLWQAGTMTELPTLGGTSGAAHGINNAGQIAGLSTGISEVIHAVLWTTEALPAHDVAVTAASASPPSVVVGASVSISSTIRNQGNVPETFDVKAYADSTLIGTVTVPALGAGTSTGVSFTWDTTSVDPGSYAIRIEADAVLGETDLADNQRGAGTVVVHLPLAAQALAPSAAYVGVAITLTCSATGGIPPFDFAWDLGDGTQVSGDSVGHAYLSTGVKTAVCTATDDSETEAVSSVTIEVYPALSLTTGASQLATLPGDPLDFSAAAAGGSGGLQYSWVFGDGESANGASVSHIYADPGEYTATVTVRDSVGGTASRSIPVTVAYLVVTATASATTVTNGRESITFSATATGGSGGPYIFTWDFGDGRTATGSTATHVYASPGSYTPKVTVVDASGNSNETVLAAITVQEASVSPLGDPVVGLAIGGVIAVVAAASVALYVTRRRRAKR